MDFVSAALFMLQLHLSFSLALQHNKTFIKVFDGARIESTPITHMKNIKDAETCAVVCVEIFACISFAYNFVIGGQCNLHSESLDAVQIVFMENWTIFATENSLLIEISRFHVIRRTQKYIVPFSGCYMITANGASGGNIIKNKNFISGGNGASVVIKTCSLFAGQRLTIAVGDQGENGSSFEGGGGGGGSFVYDETKSPPLLYLAAGGGGGAGSSDGNFNNSGTESENGQDGEENSKSGGINGNGGTCAWITSGGAGTGLFNSGTSNGGGKPGNSREKGWIGGQKNITCCGGGFGGGGSSSKLKTGAGGGFSGGGCSSFLGVKGGGGGSFCNSSHAIICTKTGGGNLLTEGSVTIVLIV